MPEPLPLRELPLFAGLPDEALESIRARVRKRAFSSGSYIITADMPGDAVYVVLSGTVKIKVDQADGKEVIVAILGPGSLVGELSVLDSSSRSADVLTQEDSSLLCMDRDTFNDLVD